jgi:RND family efflux transporter MFP subunit
VSKLSILAFVLISGSLLSACNKKDAQPVVKSTSEEIHPVQTVTVQQQNLIRTINAVGTTRFRRETPLGFTTSGKVAAVRFDEGDYVKRGALLAALDTTSVGADLSVAQAERQRTQADFERIRSLYANGWVTKPRFEAAEAAAKVAAARLRQAGFTKGTAELYAASSGIVISRLVEPGQVVSAGSPALILGQSDDGFVFRAPIIDREASKLRVGMSAEIILEALGDDPITASISEIDGRANEATGAFTVQFRLPARARMRSGQIGSAKIKVPAADDGALQIPASALFGVRTGEGLVYVVDGATSRVETRNVVIERVTDGFVIVKGGVKPGDVIVVSGAEKIRNGSRVRVIPVPVNGSPAG